MSHCDSLQNNLGMSPCNKEREIPQTMRDDAVEGSDQLESVQNGADVILTSDSGSDEETETLAAQGYITLPQSEDDIVVSSEIDQAEEETCTDNTDEKPTTIKPEEPEEFKTVLEASSPSKSAFSSSRNTQMGEDEINLIKSVMTKIQLPSSAIPEWAKKIPEEKWKQPLVTALQQRTSRNSDNTEKTSSAQSSSESV